MNLDPNHLRHLANDLLDTASDTFEDLSDKGRPYVEKACKKAKPVAQDIVRNAKVAARKARPAVEAARQAAGEAAKSARPYAEKALEGVTGALNSVFDFIEEKTSTDLDGDGVIGEAVKEAIEVEVVTDYDMADAADAAEPVVEDAEPVVEDAEPVVESAAGYAAADAVAEDVVAEAVKEDAE